MDWEEAEAEARRCFLRDEEQATYGGQPPSLDRLQGAAEGWDAAIAFIKRQMMRTMLGGAVLGGSDER